VTHGTSLARMVARHHHGVSPYEAAYGFSRAVRVADTIRVAGTAPVPEVGEDVAADAYRQMLRCGEIVSQAIDALGGSMRDVVRTRMFITDASHADDVGRAHKELFGGSDPAATMVVVTALLDPQWLVEIEVEAVVA
jgi:enamine deaminase RidA (YjgF/YER057c/UK114 family)